MNPIQRRKEAEEWKTIQPEMPDLFSNVRELKKIGRNCFHSRITRYFTLDSEEQAIKQYTKPNSKASKALKLIGAKVNIEDKEGDPRILRADAW